MSNLTKHVSANISKELWEQFDKSCRRYKKSAKQAITELIAAWVDRPDLAGSHKATSPVIARSVLKADVSIEQIRCGSAKGWLNLVEAVNDLIFLNQMILSKRYLEQAHKAAVEKYGENEQIVRDLNSLRELWKARTATLSWENASTWQGGSPTSAGFFLVVPDKGEMRLSNISDDSHPDIGNEEIKSHLRIQPPPKQKKKARIEIEQESSEARAETVYEQTVCCVSSIHASYESNGVDPVKVTPRIEIQTEPDDQPLRSPHPEQVLGEILRGNLPPDYLSHLASRSPDQLLGTQTPLSPSSHEANPEDPYPSEPPEPHQE